MKWVWGFLVLFAVALGSVLIWQRFGLNPGMSWHTVTPDKPQGTVLAHFGKAPEFSFTERSGQLFSKENLSGKPWIADFIFTSCAGQCPLMSLQMKKLQGLFPSETGFRFVSFTVDPDRDTPEVLAQYADRYEAEKERWFFLTSSKEESNRVLREFFLSPVEEPAMHSVRFILVDREGQIRGYYDSSDPGSINQLIYDAKILLKS